MRRRTRARGRSPEESETIEIRTSDGVSLRATVRDGASRARGTAVLAHAEFASRTTFDEFAQYLASQGWRTIAFDFRGHGESQDPNVILRERSDRRTPQSPPATYDDFVQRDLPTVTSCARARWKGPLVVVGHALGGHVALAACGTSAIEADAIVAVAANVWLPQFEPSRLRWQTKRATMQFVSAIVRSRGYFPARALGLGSEDASAALMISAVRAAREGRWKSDDDVVDYEQALGNVRIPVLAVASTGDKMRCVPECAERMLARCAGIKDFRLIARDDRGGPAPGHMKLITGPHASSAWETTVDWMNTI